MDLNNSSEDLDLSNHIAVAMSGGVDSSVAALLLQQEGHQVVGVSMQVWDYRNHGGCSSKATCCSPDDFTDARRVAAAIGVPYYVVDFEDTFRKNVIDKFINTYRGGETPNPCVDCNNKVKFHELRSRALSFGCSHVATGHYAQIEKRDDGYHLLRGIDKAKDQSYFLYGTKQSELGHTLFPVGKYTKDDVRQIAEESCLVTAHKPESQDICFISGTVGDFLEKQGVTSRKGSIRTKAGEKLGTHDGIHRFTVGQRKGLRIGGSDHPLYVLDIEPETNDVVVGAKSELAREGFRVSELNWIAPEILENVEKANYPYHFKAHAQLRHRHAGVPVNVEIQAADKVVAHFESEWSTVSPGQAAVFYDLSNTEVLGGGRITRQQFA